MKRIFLICCILLAGHVQAYERAPVASFVKVVANASEFERQRVSVPGVLGMDHEENLVIYLDDGSKNNVVVVNSILLWVNSEEAIKYRTLIGKYVLVTGLFTKENPRAQYSGSLKEIERIRAYPLMKNIEPISSQQGANGS